MVTEKLPPHNVEAEEAVLASILVDAEAVSRVAGNLRPSDFFRERNGWVFEVCLALWERNESIDALTIAHELSRKDRLDDVGGMAFLSRIVTELPTPVGVEHYAGIVERDALYRRLIGAAGQIAQLAYEGGPDADQALNRAEMLLLTLRGGERQRDFVHIRQLIDSFLEEPPEGEGAGAPLAIVRTGFMDLDTLLGGLKRSDLIILAARPSLGKTSLALNFTRNAAVGQRAKVAVFSLEMSADQVAQRLLSLEARVNSTRLRLGEHTEPEERRLMRAHGTLAECEIYIDDSPVLYIPDMRAKVRRLAMAHGLDLIIMDYLQLMHGNMSENRVQEISYISRSLKELAREMNVPIIAVSQLSRAVEARPSRIPMLSDLRESGSIEQDADVVMFIYREDMYIRREEWQDSHPEMPGDAYPQGLAQIIVAKHRNGPVGRVDLRFRQEYTAFEDLLLREEDANV